MLPNPVDELIQLGTVAFPLLSVLFWLGRMGLRRAWRRRFGAGSANGGAGDDLAPASGAPGCAIVPSDTEPLGKSYSEAQRARDRAEEEYIKQLPKRKSLV